MKYTEVNFVTTARDGYESNYNPCGKKGAGLLL